MEMAIPNVLRRTIDDLERRYTGPIPAESRFEACLPASIGLTDLAEIESCLDYFRWLCRSRWLQLKATARWAASSRGETGLTAISDREKFRIASRRLSEARLARDAWLEARQNYLEMSR